MNKTISYLEDFIPTILPPSTLSGFTFVNEYSAIANDFSEWFYGEYGDLELKKKINKLDTKQKINSKVNSAISHYIKINKVNLERMWETVLSEYVPIDNYDKTSTITTSYEGEKTNTIHNGTVTNTIGQRVDTQSLGGRSDSNTEKVALVDDTTFHNKNKIDNTIGSQTNSVTTGSQTNTIARTNDSNTESFNNRKDIVTEHTYGNIGVMTAMSALKEHNDLWSMFNFWSKLANVIIDAISEGVWSSEF